MGKKFLTLNIGAANIELAEYEQSGKAVKLVNYGSAALAAPLDGGNAETILVPALMGLVREKGFKPGALSVAVSGQMVFPKFAAIPMAGGGEKFEQMVRYEIEQGIPFPIDEMVCDRQVLGETENGDTSVMIVAAKVDQIESITAALQSVGFEPELIDVAPLALVNAIRQSGDATDNCVVALDIGAKTTSLVIVEGDKVYTRSIPVAGNAVTKEIANALGCSIEEAEQRKLTQAYVSLGGVTEDEDETVDCISKACRTVMTRLNAEINRSINFYRSQQKGNAPERLYLTGGSAQLAQLDVFFQEQLGIEVAVLETTKALEGVALHQAGLAHFAINLLPPSIVKAKQQKAKIPVLIAGGLALAMAFVLVALAIGNETTVIEAQRDAVQAKAEQLKNFDKKITAAQKELATLSTEAETLRDLMASRATAIQRLLAVRQSLVPGMWISSWQPGRVTIRYWIDKVPAAGGLPPSQVFAEKLEKKPCIVEKSVKIAAMTSLGATGSQDASLGQFTVEMKFK